MPITADDADEQITPDSRRGRCIAPIADVSAFLGGFDIQMYTFKTNSALGGFPAIQTTMLMCIYYNVCHVRPKSI